MVVEIQWYCELPEDDTLSGRFREIQAENGVVIVKMKRAILRNLQMSD